MFFLRPADLASCPAGDNGNHNNARRFSCPEMVIPFGNKPPGGGIAEGPAGPIEKHGVVRLIYVYDVMLYYMMLCYMILYYITLHYIYHIISYYIYHITLYYAVY